VSEQSPFQALESSFRLLCREPSPLAIHGAELGVPFPRRPIVLTELASMLLHPSVPFEARDAALRLVVRRAQERGGAWTVGLAGVLLPGLRAALATMVSAWPDAAEDLEAEVLAELVDVVASFDPAAERVASRVLWRAAQRARRRLAKEQADFGRHVSRPFPAEPHRPWGHPDFVLAEAVKAGVINAADAELVGESRLGGRSIVELAEAMGERDGTLRMRRMRAEERLVAWISRKSL
jgi:hypothetical protein